jgi:hypothetical protein
MCLNRMKHFYHCIYLMYSAMFIWCKGINLISSPIVLMCAVEFVFMNWYELWLHVSARISHYQVNSIFINSKNSEYNALEYPGVEPTTNIARGSKNNLSQTPKTSNSLGRISLSPIIWSSPCILGSTSETHYDILTVITRFNVILIQFDLVSWL